MGEYHVLLTISAKCSESQIQAITKDYSAALAKQGAAILSAELLPLDAFSQSEKKHIQINCAITEGQHRTALDQANKKALKDKQILNHLIIKAGEYKEPETVQSLF